MYTKSIALALSLILLLVTSVFAVTVDWQASSLTRSSLFLRQGNIEITCDSNKTPCDTHNISPGTSIVFDDDPGWPPKINESRPWAVSSWSSWTAVPNITIQGTPAAASSNGQRGKALYIVYTSTSDGTIKALDWSTAHGAQRIVSLPSSMTSSRGPAALFHRTGVYKGSPAGFKSRLFVAAIRPSGEIRVSASNQTNNFITSFSSWVSLGEPATAGSGLNNFAPSLNEVTRDKDKSFLQLSVSGDHFIPSVNVQGRDPIWHRTQTNSSSTGIGAWGPWEKDGGKIRSQWRAAKVGLFSGDDWSFFHYHVDNRFSEYVRSDRSFPNQRLRFPILGGPSGTPIAGTALFSDNGVSADANPRSSNSIYIAVRDRNGATWVNRKRNRAVQSWDGWLALGGSTQNDVEIIVHGRQAIVFHRGNDSKIYYRVYQ